MVEENRTAELELGRIIYGLRLSSDEILLDKIIELVEKKHTSKFYTDFEDKVLDFCKEEILNRLKAK